MSEDKDVFRQFAESMGPAVAIAKAVSGGDLVDRLRKEAADCVDFGGQRLENWDKIRRLVETHKGSDLPRLAYEGELEDFHGLLSEAATEIASLRERVRVLEAENAELKRLVDLAAEVGFDAS